MMFEALILGIVQGLTEFLPVSSTAHLILFPWFLNWGGILNSLTFDVALHAGTLFSLILCFWKDWADIIIRRRRLLWLILIATIPAGVLGKLFNDVIEERLRNPYIISAALAAIGFFMLAAERSNKDRKIDDLRLFDAVIIGISQAIALIPGVSRSGITISSGLFRGLDRTSSARFSFLLSTPVIAGATLLHAAKIMTGAAQYDLTLFTAGFIASALTGFAAIKFLLNFFKTHPLNIFVYYRFALAVVIIIGIWLKG